ncbi:hypothetical protein ACJQWY_06140 [Weissella kandleri]|uniref:hypothetical protein n=1 Tax=Weissella kandleri TaxID=1616 RepID=UPI00387EB121
MNYNNLFTHASPSSLLLTISIDYLLVGLINPVTPVLKFVVILLILPDVFSAFMSFKNFLQENKSEWSTKL